MERRPTPGALAAGLLAAFAGNFDAAIGCLVMALEELRAAQRRKLSSDAGRPAS